MDSFKGFTPIINLNPYQNQLYQNQSFNQSYKYDQPMNTNQFYNSNYLSTALWTGPHYQSNYLQPHPNPGGYPPTYSIAPIPNAPLTLTPNLTQNVSMNQNSPVVLIVSNLDSKVEPDHLFTLFGVYGDVLRVKILFNKPDTALIQFVNSQHCMVANDHLNNAPLFGKPISVNFSKHTSVALPRQGASEQEHKLTRDYSGSPLHRFRVANSKNYQHICPPSSVVHVSNMSPNSSEKDLEDLFSRYGSVVAVKFFSW